MYKRQDQAQALMQIQKADAFALQLGVLLKQFAELLQDGFGKSLAVVLHAQAKILVFRPQGDVHQKQMCIRDRIFPRRCLP